MNTLTIYKDNFAGSTVVSNRFIDEYMIDANDAQIKVYLYLIRMMSANLPTGISDMADKFNHTEKDIMRALKYWESKKILSLEYDDAKNLTGICFVNSPAKEDEAKPLAPIVPLKLVTEHSAEKPDKNQVGDSKKDYDYISYSRDQLKEFRNNPDTSQISFVAEAYLNRTLSLNDLGILYFIHYDLGFSCELIDYLIETCVAFEKKKGHNNLQFSYIKKVALDWADHNIKSTKEAKAYIISSFDTDVYSILKLLGRTSTPTESEAVIVEKWYKDYAFTMDIIEKACERTVIATDTHRLEYCDKILSSWKKSGVKNLGDIAALDASHKKSKPVSTPVKNTFNQMIHTDYDFDEIERQILSN